jgi:DNA repair exonuclease SbcCD ATPase subunit
MENPAEVQELRNKLRMMNFPPGEILNTVRRQQRAIHKQKLANETLRTEIQEYETQNAEMKRMVEAHDSNKELQELQIWNKTYANKIAVLAADVAAEKNKQKKLSEDVSKAHSHSGGLFTQLRQNEDLQARVRTMENRLDKAFLRYNRSLKKLEALRDEIDEYRKDRRNFRDTVKSAGQTRAQKDQEMATLISDSNNAYSERDRRKMDLVRLKAAERTDVKAFEEKLELLNRTIEAQKVAAGHQVGGHPSEAVLDSGLAAQSDQQDDLTAISDQLHNTTQAILEMCHVKDVQELFSEAEKLERQNYSLYKYVVENGAVRSQLQEEIDGLELQRQALIAQTQLDDGEQSKILEKLTAEIQKVAAELQEIQTEKASNEIEFESVYTEIGNIFNVLGCSWENAPDGKTTATPSNSLFCLSQIESAIAEMMKNAYERTRMQALGRGDFKISEYISEEMIEQMKHPSTTVAKIVPDKEITGKFADANRPLTLDEMRRLLNDENKPIEY